MKTVSYLFLFIVLVITAFTGCREDEAAAPGSVSDLIVYPGKNRAKVEFKTPSDAKSGKVFYGSGKFHEFNVTDSSAQSVIVSGLAEGRQILRVVTINADGLISDPKGAVVDVYGNNYLNTLNSRPLISQNTISPTSVEIFFGQASASEVEVRVVFTNISGARDSIKMNNTQTSIIVNNINLNEKYYFYSVYKPVPESIDEFLTARVDAKNAAMLNFEKNNWIIAGFSDQEPGSDGKWALAKYIIDNNISTFWHSEVVASTPPMPHWIVVDMQSEKKIAGFYFIQTQETAEQGLAKGFKFEVSRDNQNWTNIMEGEFAFTRYKQVMTFPESVVSRYFKITILSGYNNAFWSQIAEIDLFNEEKASGDNGQIAPTEVPLVNAKKPFQGDGSDLFPAVGAGRMQKLVGWTHNQNAYISFDSQPGINTFTLFSAPVWGVGDVTNGKIYQTVNLQAGSYTLKIDVGSVTDATCADVYGVVVKGVEVPDYTAVASATEVLGYSDLVANQLKVNSISFTLTTASPVTVGVVYNTHNIYETKGIPWSEVHINGFELLINQ